MNKKTRGHGPLRNDTFHFGTIFWCGILSNILLLTLVVLSLVFFIGTGDMKETASEALKMSKKMLKFTDEMRESLPIEDIMYLITGAITFVNATDFKSMDRLLKGAVSFMNETDFESIDHIVKGAATFLDEGMNFDQLPDRYLKVIDTVMRASNETDLILEDLQQLDLSGIMRDTAQTITLLNSVAPSYVQQTQEIMAEVRNITESARDILAHLFKTHKVNIEI